LRTVPKPRRIREHRNFLRRRRWQHEQ